MMMTKIATTATVAARKSFAEMKDQKAAQEQEELDKAATMMQCQFRKKVARKSFKERQKEFAEETKAATKVQSIIRGKQGTVLSNMSQNPVPS